MIIDCLKRNLTSYEFQRGCEENLEDVYQLELENIEFFGRIQNHEPTREEIRRDFYVRPSGVLKENKHFFVVYEGGLCVALLDYLEGFPDRETVYLGFFMVKKEAQGAGVGRKLQAAFMGAAAECGYQRIKLACYAENEKGYRFWRRNRYIAERVSERQNDGQSYFLVHMICDISDPHMFDADLDSKIVIREEKETDYYQAELMVKRAFWNKYQRGCMEHYLLHRLRQDVDFVPGLSRIAEVAGRIVGGIWYSKSTIKVEAEEHEVLTFGPLCVEVEYQGMGVGGILLRETIEIAKTLGYEGIIILGEPGYYPKFGFLPCEYFGITTADGKNFDAFLGMELKAGAFTKLRGGRFFEAELFERLDERAVEEYDKKFPDMEKLTLPGQWD